MGLNAALVDRARRVTATAEPRKVEGSTEFVTTHGAWFRVRLTLPPAATTEASARVRAGLASNDGRTKTTERPFLLMGIRDSSGESLMDEDGRCVVTSQDRIEVDSPQLGRYLYEVTEDPSPVRKKRKVIGFNASLSRVAEHEFTTALGGP